jgi:hypothetical protein
MADRFDQSTFCSVFFFSLAESVSQPILSFPLPFPWLFSYGNELFSSTGRLRGA